MRERDAKRAALRFIAERYPGYAHWHFDIALEHDGDRNKSWSFGLRPDEEDDDYEPGLNMVGYVHANGHVEGLY
mgnify:CR=1 FL=1